MKILLVGAHGTVGRGVAAELAQRHEIVDAGRRGASVTLDLADADSIRRALESVGPVDAIVSAAGQVGWAPLLELTPEQWAFSVANKLMGQVNLALVGQAYLRDGGSITLTSGVLVDQPVRYGAAASLANGAIEAFVRAAAIELPRGLRINAVSPGVLLESMSELGPFFRGFEPVPAARVALAYSRSVEGAETGRVYPVR
ncbi:short chain dehydrogenase [Vulcaniibacterium thermophilum]|uniref:Short chain dehydrogenase n=1 Tax=Vulcaniibacterium thermophilum TaxID=1169913 RepID=A0A918YUL8_9GAMM|nr:short chain dehydrogenase [Vulcaniibacterium thermophilum]GHE25690.1 short chain dehydrogenase [Vulcaniibacterium thermophilum]